MTSLLEGVIQSGTGAAVRGLGVSGAVAGKTGTTNDGRDAWFVGYTPRLLTVVWIGFDGGDAHGLSGAEAALPMWADFMSRRSRLIRIRASTCRAASLRRRSISPTASRQPLLSVVIARETFLAGTEPPACEEHGGLVDQIG